MPRPRPPKHPKVFAVRGEADAWGAVYAALGVTPVRRSDLEAALAVATRDVGLYRRLHGLKGIVSSAVKAEVALRSLSPSADDVSSLRGVSIADATGARVELGTVAAHYAEALAMTQAYAGILAAFSKATTQGRGRPSDSADAIFASRLMEELQHRGFLPSQKAVAYLAVIGGVSRAPGTRVDQHEMAWRKTCERGMRLLAKHRAALTAVARLAEGGPAKATGADSDQEPTPSLLPAP